MLTATRVPAVSPAANVPPAGFVPSLRKWKPDDGPGGILVRCRADANGAPHVQQVQMIGGPVRSSGTIAPPPPPLKPIDFVVHQPRTGQNVSGLLPPRKLQK